MNVTNALDHHRLVIPARRPEAEEVDEDVTAAGVVVTAAAGVVADAVGSETVAGMIDVSGRLTDEEAADVVLLEAPG